ncbi:excalibur calcium-binding domain-containing protein [Myxococcus sp. 1LA]
MRSIACLFMVVSALMLGACGEVFAGSCVDTNCADYTSQSAAQAAYEADPECRADLDADKDGVACEEEGNGVRWCPSTSACGCSNKNKSACGGDPCCRWVVGSGCGCR